MNTPHNQSVETNRRLASPLKAGRSLLSETSWFDAWQHLDLAPGQMGRPVVRRQASGRVALAHGPHTRQRAARARVLRVER